MGRRLRGYHWLLVAILAPAAWLALIAAHTCWIELRAVHPPRAQVEPAGPELHGLSVRDVSFATVDGARLEGWHIPSRNGASVALFHGYGNSRNQMEPEAAILARRGYGVLLLDSRAHGNSGGSRTTYGDLERNDVRAAIDFLASQADTQPGQLGLLGFSAGASPLAAVAAKDPRVAAVVLEGAVTSAADFSEDEAGGWAWLKAPIAISAMRTNGIDFDAIRPIDAVAELSPKALLVVHGKEDPLIPLERPTALYAAARQPKQLLLVAGAGHGGFAAAQPETYPRALLAFFDQHLLGASAHAQGALPP